MGSGLVKPQHGHNSFAGKEVEFTINGKPYKVSDGIAADTSLNSFIREHANLKGTKFMCLEGGCGACIVGAKIRQPSSGKTVNMAVNSCMVPVLSCHGWSVTTVEGLGNRHSGYDKIQRRLAAANGTQCGYCSPGMVMNMYSLLEDNPKITMAEVENSFGGNMCRCTGYRPILDAFKSLASDAPKDLTEKLADIEDLLCPNTGALCEGKCGERCGQDRSTMPDIGHSALLVVLDGQDWYRPTHLTEVFQIFDMIGNKRYRIVAGNTGQGVYRILEDPEVYIDVSGIGELEEITTTSSGLVLGGNVSLTRAMDFFRRQAAETPHRFKYLATLAEHIDLIANVPVRNTGTLAGNIYMKHVHNNFPSDIFLILEMVGAQLVIADKTGVDSTVSLLNFLKMDMNQKVISKILLPNLDNTVYVTKSYKIMPRAQNAHAYVNAGFMFKLNKSGKHQIQERPTIVFGGINQHFMHATKTENYLEGKGLLEEKILEESLKILDSEILPDHELPDASPEFRKGLAVALFYKFVLSLGEVSVNPRYRSGGSVLKRPLSSAKQEFDTNRNVWPLNKPIPKIEALIQCSGEAEYTNDISNFPGQLWGQLVLSERALASIKTIDASEALKIKGVVAFFSAKDIPGANSFTPQGFNNTETEPVFAEGKTDYAGQAVGVVLADNHQLAVKAALRVKIVYGEAGKPMINARQIVDDNLTGRIKEMARKDPTDTKSDVKYKVKGRWDIQSQYHYTMETQTCIAVPTEDGLDLYPSSQWPSTVQEAISLAVGIPLNRINIRVRRLGGGYGAKLSRSSHVAVVTALSAHLLHKPVRMVLSLEANMEWAGKRFPILADYEADVSDSGEIQSMTVKVYEDEGHSLNDASVGGTLHHLPNCYDASTWSLLGYAVRTDLPSNSWCRAPGSTEAVCLIENIMEHISRVVKRDPVDVRLQNMRKADGYPVRQLMEDIMKSSEYKQRLEKVGAFNKENRWKKRGISLVAMDYPFGYYGKFYGMVSIYEYDGTVAIIHGGVEMGQGLNTKVSQVAAHVLGIGMEFISIKPTMNHTAPNNSGTGGSVGSESVAYAIKKCCEELNNRLEPAKKKLGDKASWKEIIAEAGRGNVNLNASYMFTRDDAKGYPIYGATVTEVEVDLLTGQYQLVRADITEDAGESLSPEVDVGQVEGAFVMGLGYYTSEEILHHPDTGRLLTNRTWNYKPPGVKDIPVDFRVTLRKKSTNPVGVLRSKATGEPPLCMSCSVLFAIRSALESARKESGQKDEDWFKIDQPFTGERIWLATLNKKDMYKLS